MCICELVISVRFYEMDCMLSGAGIQLMVTTYMTSMHSVVENGSTWVNQRMPTIQLNNDATSHTITIRRICCLRWSWRFWVLTHRFWFITRFFQRYDYKDMFNKQFILGEWELSLFKGNGILLYFINLGALLCFVLKLLFSLGWHLEFTTPWHW